MLFGVVLGPKGLLKLTPSQFAPVQPPFSVPTVSWAKLEFRLNKKTKTPHRKGDFFVGRAGFEPTKA